MFNLNRLRFERRHPLALHRDERGTISMLTLVILLAFTMILGMLINVGREVDDKIRLQNAVDASTYSSGVVLARGMNTIAFTNHLLCEVCGMTAYMREGRDRSSEKMVPDVLAAWAKLGPIFAKSPFEKFARLGPAISGRVPLETELVASFGEMTAIKSKIMLPALEYILGQPEPMGGDPTSHWIPQFQRAVVQAVPQVAQYTMKEVAGRHAGAQQGQGQQGQQPQRSQPLSGALWRWMVIPVGAQYEDDPYLRTLPMVDCTSTGSDAGRLTGSDLQILQTASRDARRLLAHHYLEQWIADDYWDMAPFEPAADRPDGRSYAKMSQFANIWRIFTCAQLEQLLTQEYPNTNLPHMLRVPANPPQTPYRRPIMGQDPYLDFTSSRSVLEKDYTWVGVTYWPHMAQTFPGMYRHPIQADALMFAQVQVYIPLPRYRYAPWAWPVVYTDANGQQRISWINNMDNWPTDWNSFNQNWTSGLMPATHPQLPAILQTPPGQIAPQARMPSLQGVDSSVINTINTH